MSIVVVACVACYQNGLEDCECNESKSGIPWRSTVSDDLDKLLDDAFPDPKNPLIKHLRPTTIAAIISDIAEAEGEFEVEEVAVNFKRECWLELVVHVGKADAAKLVDGAFS